MLVTIFKIKQIHIIHNLNDRLDQALDAFDFEDGHFETSS